MTDNNKAQNINNKLNVITTVLRLGHEAFKRDNLNSAALHILNNTRLLTKYDRACLLDMRGDRPVVIGISGQSEVKHSSEYSINIKKLIDPLKRIKEVAVLDKELLRKNRAPESSIKAYDYFLDQGDNLVLIPLIKPGDGLEESNSIFWIVEFFGEFDNNNINILSLLAQHYREAVWYFLKSDKKLINLLKNKKHFSPVKVILYLIIIFIIISFFRISQNVAANFELVPLEEAIEYAPYSGIIEDAYFKDGDQVKADDNILKYDIQELTYSLADAESAYNEISAELDWVKQKSFIDERELGKVRILAMKRQKEKVEIEKIKWYLSKAEIKAEISGTLILNDSEKWHGKAVRAGEKLFEVVSSKRLQAEVALNEADASVLGKDTKITLYLHSSPETPIYGKVVSVSPKPMLTKTGQFCYIITLDLADVKPGYIVGMRGVARVSGEKVSIGYYLFKNLVLWWRKV